MPNLKKQLLILGGGFGGIKTALELADNPAFSVTLISDHSDFRYYPTLFHAATGGRSAASSIPLSEIFAGKSVSLVLDEIKTIDRAKKKVAGASGKRYAYDVLVLALGVVTNYINIKGLEKYSYGIKTLDEAHHLKDHLHKLIADEGKPDLNYVIIGGGPTGVELAGALPGYLKFIMKNHGIKQKNLHIDLIEAMPHLMPRMSVHYSRAVARRLRKLGIKLHLKQAVKAETADTLQVGDHDIKSHTVVWTAGVTNHPFFKQNGFNLSVHGKVVTDQYLEAEPSIYVIGDNADTPFSGLAQTALYDAKYVAYNLKRTVEGKAPLSYKPKRPIYVTPIGPRWAAVQWGRVEIYGWLGWLLRKIADFAGYHDYEPWWLAGQHWAASSLSEETCSVCAASEN